MSLVQSVYHPQCFINDVSTRYLHCVTQWSGLLVLGINADYGNSLMTIGHRREISYFIFCAGTHYALMLSALNQSFCKRNVSSIKFNDCRPLIESA